MCWLLGMRRYAEHGAPSNQDHAWHYPEQLRDRRIPFYGYARTGKDSGSLDPDKRFTALPPELLCLRGPTAYEQVRVEADV